MIVPRTSFSLFLFFLFFFTCWICQDLIYMKVIEYYMIYIVRVKYFLTLALSVWLARNRSISPDSFSIILFDG